MIIKFNSSGLNTPGDFTHQGTAISVDILSPPDVLGFRVFIPNIGDIRIQNDDYIIVRNGERKVILRSDYLANSQLSRLVTEEIGIQLLEDMIQALQDLPVLDAVKLDLLKTVDVVLIMVVGNKINAARTICNAIATTANFSTTRKNALLALLDAAILLL